MRFRNQLPNRQILGFVDFLSGELVFVLFIPSCNRLPIIFAPVLTAAFVPMLRARLAGLAADTAVPYADPALPAASRP